MTYQKRLPLNDIGVTSQDIKLDSSGRARRTIRFFLDAAKPEEAAIGREIENLSKKRKFASFIRDAIRLMFALREGDLSVLVELFPSAVEQIKADARAEMAQSQKDASVAVQQFEDLFDAIAQKLDRIENKQSALEPVSQMPAPASVGLKPLGGGGLKSLGSAKPLAAPVFDEDDDELVVQKAEGNSDAAMNFINSMMALQRK